MQADPPSRRPGVSFCSYVLRYCHALVVPAISLAQAHQSTCFWVGSAQGRHVPSLCEVRNTLSFSFSLPPLQLVQPGVFISAAADANLARLILLKGCCSLGRVTLLLYPSLASAIAASNLGQEGGDITSDDGGTSAKFQTSHSANLVRPSGPPGERHASMSPKVFRTVNCSTLALLPPDTPRAHPCDIFEPDTSTASGMAQPLDFEQTPTRLAPKSYLQALLSPIPAPLKRDGERPLRRARSLPHLELSALGAFALIILLQPAGIRYVAERASAMATGPSPTRWRGLRQARVGRGALDARHPGRSRHRRHDVPRSRRPSVSPPGASLLSTCEAPTPICFHPSDPFLARATGGRGGWSGARPSGSTSASTNVNGHTTRALGALLYPSVPLWSFVAGAFDAHARAMSLAGVPRVEINDLPSPTRPHTPAPAPPTDICEESDEVVQACNSTRSTIPSFLDLLGEEEHEVSVRRRRARRKRAVDSVSKLRRSSRLASKEEPFYMDATTKATRVKAAKLDLSKASSKMKVALIDAGIMARPPSQRIRPVKLHHLGRVCGLANLSEVEDDEVPTEAN